MRSYARPQTLEQAVDALRTGQGRILAGGTDIYPGAGQQLDGHIIDVSAVAEISGITAGDGLRIGACTTWSAIADANLPPALRALQLAARQIGGRQIQNAGTIGGNLCNASPAADGVPPLLALDAQVELGSCRGMRHLPLADFLLGPRKTARASDEMLVAILIPQHALSGCSAFAKLGARAYLVISIAMVAARIVMADGRISAAAIAVGACSGTARRIPAAEAALLGAAPGDVTARLARLDLGAVLAPIDDIRASADYRLTAAADLIRRAVTEAVA